MSESYCTQEASTNGRALPGCRLRQLLHWRCSRSANVHPHHSVVGLEPTQTCTLSDLTCAKKGSCPEAAHPLTWPAQELQHALHVPRKARSRQVVCSVFGSCPTPDVRAHACTMLCTRIQTKRAACGDVAGSYQHVGLSCCRCQAHVMGVRVRVLATDRT